MHTQPVLRTWHVRHGFCLRRQLRLPAPPSASLFLGRSTIKAARHPTIAATGSPIHSPQGYVYSRPVLALSPCLWYY